MSEKQDISQTASHQALASAHGKLSLVNSLIILIILYLATGTIVLFITSRQPELVTWLEAGQWLLVIIWLLIGVRPPFTRWLKRARERGE